MRGMKIFYYAAIFSLVGLKAAGVLEEKLFFALTLPLLLFIFLRVSRREFLFAYVLFLFGFSYNVGSKVVFSVGTVVYIACVVLALDYLKRYERISVKTEKSVMTLGEDIAKLSAQVGKLTEENKHEENNVLLIIQAYEVAKTLSECMTWEKLLEVLARLREDIYECRQCLLIAFPHKENTFEKTKIYDVTSRYPKHINEKAFDQQTIDYIKDLKRPVFLEKEALSELGVNFKEPAAHYALVPVVFDEHVVGCLIAIGLAYKDFHIFEIFGSQLGLEMRKIFLYEKVERLSIRDGLTGLFARRYFIERSHKELERAKKYSFDIAIIMLDIDFFKRINDTYGHLAGDAVLESLSASMQSHVRQIDIVARYGGEEFILLLPETSKEGGLEMAERIRKLVAEYKVSAYDEEIAVNVSCGVSAFPEDGHDLIKLIEYADSALYRAKKSGRNQSCIYEKQ
jgi:diguanylate cyclase (GGDEF)-like protein